MSLRLGIKNKEKERKTRFLCYISIKLIRTGEVHQTRQYVARLVWFDQKHAWSMTLSGAITPN